MGLDPLGDNRRGPKSPEEDAFVLSRLTFWWMNPLFRVGYKRQLQEQDVYEVLDRFRAKVVGTQLDAGWNAEIARSGQHHRGRAIGSNQGILEWIGLKKQRVTSEQEKEEGYFEPRPKLLMAVARTFWPEYVKSGLFIEVQDVCAIATPMLIQKIIEFIQKTQGAAVKADRPPAWHGYGLALLMLIVTIVQAICAQNWVYHALRTSIPARTAIVHLIFSKATRLSPKARQMFPDGKIVNLISNDTFRVELVPFYLWYMFSIPIFLLVITGLLIHLMGPSALLGAAILVITNPLQGWAMARLGPWRRRIATVADQRLSWTHQILRAIQVIKFFAWEPSFLKRVAELRSKEVVMVRQLLLIRGLISATASATPVLASAMSFVLYAGLGHRLDASIIFPALAFYNSMRTQMNIWPTGFSILTDGRVSAKRIEEFLLAEESQPLPDPDMTSPWALEIQDGCFYWDRVQSSEDSEKAKNQANKNGDAKIKSDDNNNGKTKDSKPPLSSSPILRNNSNNSDQCKIQPLSEMSSPLANEIISANDPSRHVFLRDIRLQIPRGALVAVIGAVGHGKSSLLQAMAGTMPQQSGHLVRGSRISVASQTPWIQNASVRDNILFDMPYDPVRYQRVLKACQLERDIAALLKGDLTEIGERGVNLSGGQKARLSLARAVYFDAETVIMDDPLSAVDAHVGRRLWQDCVLSEMKGRTRIVATHQLHVLQDVDWIVCMKDGRISQTGSFEELMNDPTNNAFRTLITEYGGLDDTSSGTDSSVSDNNLEVRPGDEEEIANVDGEVEEEEAKAKGKSSSKKEGDQLSDIDEADIPIADEDKRLDSDAIGKQMVKEERKYGAITFKAYRQFFHAVGWILWGGVFSAYFVQQGASIMMNLWLSFWSAGNYTLTHWQYIGVYIGLVFGQLVFNYLAAMILAYVVAKTGEVLHQDAIKSVLRAKMSFFETNPLGRILSRFSKDVDSLDNSLHQNMNDYITVCFSLGGILVLMITLIPWMAIAVPPLACLFYFVSVYSRATTRELKRLDSVLRAELVSYQSESLSGMETMRAYQVLPRAIAKSQVKQDIANRPNYAMQYSTRWAALNGIFVGITVTFVANMVIVASRATMKAGKVGLVLSYLIQVGSLLNWTLQRYAAMEMAMNSAERLDDYIHSIDHEAPPHWPQGKRERAKLEPNWPQHGHIIFANVSLRYRPELPLILKNVSFEIQAGQKIGVVGRTGAGKSSLIQALFRIVEIESSALSSSSSSFLPLQSVPRSQQQSGIGRVLVDGHNIAELDLADLRSRIAIIPQDPTLFEGTFRSNLDPLARFSEQELWRALETADLKSYVQAQDGGLDAPVATQGENLSVGQRQLLCLARALLIKSKVVILDEATASVDLATDALIQKAIRVDFANSTVFTIAHRLNTVIDFDKVLVLDHGRVAEFDTPHALLSRPPGGSLFGQLVDETGPQNATMLRTMAAKASARSRVDYSVGT